MSMIAKCRDERSRLCVQDSKMLRLTEAPCVSMIVVWGVAGRSSWRGARRWTHGRRRSSSSRPRSWAHDSRAPSDRPINTCREVPESSRNRPQGQGGKGTGEAPQARKHIVNIHMTRYKPCNVFLLTHSRSIRALIYICKLHVVLHNTRQWGFTFASSCVITSVANIVHSLNHIQIQRPPTRYPGVDRVSIIQRDIWYRFRTQ